METKNQLNSHCIRNRGIHFPSWVQVSTEGMMMLHYVVLFLMLFWNTRRYYIMSCFCPDCIFAVEWHSIFGIPNSDSGCSSIYQERRIFILLCRPSSKPLDEDWVGWVWFKFLSTAVAVTTAAAAAAAAPAAALLRCCCCCCCCPVQLQMLPIDVADIFIHPPWSHSCCNVITHQEEKQLYHPQQRQRFSQQQGHQYISILKEAELDQQPSTQQQQGQQQQQPAQQQQQQQGCRGQAAAEAAAAAATTTTLPGSPKTRQHQGQQQEQQHHHYYQQAQQTLQGEAGATATAARVQLRQGQQRP